MGTPRTRVMIVAGEASGDAAGAALARELREVHGAFPYGVGGPQMRRAGVQILFDSSTWSCLGLSEGLRMIPRTISAFRRLARHLTENPPEAVVPIDFGAFNVPLARKALQANVPVLYFMPPRSWDRDPERVHSVARAATKIATPFRWSAQFLRRDGGDAEFVGHPLIDFCRDRRSREAACVSLGLDPGRPVVGLLPGSRRQEMTHVLPLCLGGACELRALRADLQFVVGPAPNIPRQLVERELQRRGLDIPLVQDMTYDIMSAADVLIVASGTATLEAACLGTPMVVVYDGPLIGRFEFLLTRRVRHVALPNIIAGKTVVPELLGEAAASGPRVAEVTLQLLENDGMRRRMLRDLRQVRDDLGPEGAIRRTSQLVMEVARRRTELCAEEAKPSPNRL